jgi:exopolyphosphatase
MSSSPSPTIRWREGSETALTTGVRALNAFLAQARSELFAVVADDTANASTTVVRVVIGNEAADADSIISALVYAHHKRRHATANGSIIVPVVPVPRDELALRCDVVSLFKELHVDERALVFVDEFPWRDAAFQAGGRARLEFTLVDHNALSTKRLGGDESVGRVVEILDHHMDLGKHPDAAVREIAFADGQALVASSCTLVAEKLLHTRGGTEMDALHATLLLAVIALDSVNFDPRAKKVTARDVAAAEALETTAFAPKEALFHWLQAAKFSTDHWAAFTVRNCLQCDYKEFDLPPKSGRYGVSAVLIDLERFVAKAASGEALVTQLEAFVAANRLVFLLVMTMFVDAEGSRHRQLLFYGAGGDTSVPRTCVAFLEREGSLELAPLELPASHADRRLLTFSQRNAGASRKQVVPLLQRALEDGGKL